MLSLLLPAAALLSWPDPRARTRLAAVRPSNVTGFGSGSPRVRAVPIAVPCGVVVAALLAGVGGALASGVAAAVGLWWWRGRGADRRRLARAAALAAGLRLLVAELRAGSHPASAAEGAAAEADPAVSGVFRDLAATARLGGDAAAVLISAAGSGPVERGGDPLARAGRAWALADRHGVALAELLDSVRRDLEHRVAFAHDVEAKLAGPRSTAAVLAGLPLLGLALGQASGADPLAVLANGLLGQALLVAGVSLLCAGVVWTVRLTESVVRP
ncbi:type II secretion system F family protein [Saccharopolyspora sp. NFXS83]|uniref:type II secretion system F family protein n=1 Tax=Saccharopolyspora sp. NFXS83 TaxID=2993560 RepID=UPI00224A69BE|nr:type II secretion system F family protein [Saccharopolyspora sp. NFXS83]MCX2732865.1 type II secretion system F family protein [Saccharopolyspora sp. NFXS83]